MCNVLVANDWLLTLIDETKNDKCSKFSETENIKIDNEINPYS